MKATRNIVKPAFVPITLTIESQREYDKLVTILTAVEHDASLLMETHGMANAFLRALQNPVETRDE